MQRHVTTLEAEPDGRRAKAWKRMAASLATLASDTLKASGQNVVQFLVADGKYRMQVFAMEDTGPGGLAVYCSDVLDRAVKAKLIKP